MQSKDNARDVHRCVCVCVCACVSVWSSCTDNARHGGGTDVYSRVYGKPLDLSKTMVDLAAQDE